MPPIAGSDGGSGSSRAPKRKHDISSSTSAARRPLSRAPKRQKTLDARSILTQSSEAALSNGELDLHTFLKAREFEIQALEDGMSRAKGALTTRAFQQVPRDMRRRTASHNVKRVPKRMQKRAAREMKDDNTPTVKPGKKTTGSRGWLRAETARKLSILGRGEKAEEEKGKVKRSCKIEGRAPMPKLKKGFLSEPQKPKSKFRKRQMHKTWLPTHMYHAKRAKMTEPPSPLWRFALPISPTEKSYRPTHRAAGQRGAVCWDMSYMSTIGLEGTEGCLEKILRAVGIHGEDSAWGKRGIKWREGKRTWSGWTGREANGQPRKIAPATFIWCAESEKSKENREGDSLPTNFTAEGELRMDGEQTKKSKKPLRRRLLIRVHPSAFVELWTEVMRLAKMQRPVAHVEDLRFEIGSIELTGPGSTEALLGILHPVAQDGHSHAFKALAGVTNSASLPPNSLLTFSIMDPRLRYPPRKAIFPKPTDEEAAFKLLETVSAWAADQSSPSSDFFDREIRHKAAQLPSQKAINRRKGNVAPGEYPSRLEQDPAIPVMLYSSRNASSSSDQGSWVLMAPWKCLLPIWYGLMHYPLSSGGNPRFGGLQELQQLSFENGKPWFPGDFPGTDSGWAWEIDRREERKRWWDSRPKGKKIELQSLDLGSGKKGELGAGWSCDFETVLKTYTTLNAEDSNMAKKGGKEKEEKLVKAVSSPLHHLPAATFQSILSKTTLNFPPTSVAVVRLRFFSTGVPQPCARIYRLPSDLAPTSPTKTQSNPTDPKPDKTDTTLPITTNPFPPTLRGQWLALAPSLSQKAPRDKRTAKQPQPRIPKTANISDRYRAIAHSLIQSPPLPYPKPKQETTYPVVPGEEDLIGFVTTGAFNLSVGSGTGVGCLVVAKLMEGTLSGRKGKMCIIRNVGESVGRLAHWDIV